MRIDPKLLKLLKQLIGMAAIMGRINEEQEEALQLLIKSFVAENNAKVAGSQKTV
jgi:hypothetical protein